MKPLEVFQHAGCLISLYPDDNPSSPADWDTVGTLATAHRNYRFQEELSDHPAYARGGGRMLERYLELSGGAYIPVAMIDHSGISLYESRGAHPMDPGGWDSGRIGILYAAASAIADAGLDRDSVLDVLRSELHEWDAYVRGDVIGYVVTTPDGFVVDSCWGYYPDGSESSDGFDYVRAEAREAAEYEALERDRAARQGIATGGAV